MIRLCKRRITGIDHSYGVRLVLAVCLGMAVVSSPACRTTEDRLSASRAKAEAPGRIRHDSKKIIPHSELQREQRLLDEFCAKSKCPGVTVAFVLPDGQKAALAAGYANVTNHVPMKPTDRMLSGSIGKTYVAAVALQLVEEGKLHLDAEIGKWFRDEEWFARLPNGQHITVRMLMNHTSGICRHIFTPEFQAAVKAEPQRVWRPEELLSYVLDEKPLFAPGEGWSYADTNYILLGMIIERITGQAYYRELEERILGPLGLGATSPSDRPDLEGLVSGYSTAENLLGLPVEVAKDGRYGINPQLEWTGGGLVTTSLDLARWAGMLYGHEVLSAASRQQMFDGVPMSEGSDRHYGLGVMMRPSRHGRVVGHSGYMPGYISMMAYYPGQELALAVQVNGEEGISGQVLEQLLDDMVDDLLVRD